jgi:hypothetical protein
VAALEYMPLAITQAAAFLQQSRRKYTIARYIEDLEKLDASNDALIDRDHGDLRRDPDASNAIMLTWQISFEYIVQTRRSAAELLSLMSLCDRHSIPELLISPALESESIAFDDDVTMLVEFSFVAEASYESSFEMHRLVQIATRKWMAWRGELRTRVDQFVVKLENTMPWAEHSNNARCEVLFPHVRYAMELEQYVSTAATPWRLVLDKGATYASSRGSRAFLLQAIEMGMRWGEASKRVLGEEHRDTLVSISNLAGYYDRLGDSGRAAEIGEQCWAASQRVLGEEHLDTLVSM